jgi:hypothetical protein
MTPCKCGNPACNYHDLAAWDDDDLWVRTTASLVRDVREHRAMLVAKIERLSHELAGAEAELRQFAYEIDDAATGK